MVHELVLGANPGVRVETHPWKDHHLASELRDDECDVQAWTGLCDRNGKDVYEGDIFYHDDGNVVVAWLGGSFDGIFEDGNAVPLWEVTSGLAGVNEVIGNIYENPEMWKAN
jgi:hypothetical protein